MPTVRLSFTPAPAHVRTARLVGVAVARKAGVSAELFDEIRLAVGEACSRAVALHRQHGLVDLVDVLIEDDADFTIRVTDRAPIDAALGPALPDLLDPVALLDISPPLASPDSGVTGEHAATEETVAVNMRLALLAGLVDEISVRPADDGPGTEVRMTWPTGSGRNGAGRP
ncbi:MAG TPA: ATP-binding protein [Rugosimonospora sp.]|nr:ATP-binding protein [Rugosimonospora sp.]